MSDKQTRRERSLAKPLKKGYKRRCHDCGRQYKTVAGHLKHKKYYCYYRPERIEAERLKNIEFEVRQKLEQKRQEHDDKAEDLWVDPKHKRWAQEGTMIGGLTLVKYPAEHGSYQYRWVRLPAHEEMVALGDGVEKEEPTLTWRMKLRAKLWRFLQWI